MECQKIKLFILLIISYIGLVQSYTLEEVEMPPNLNDIRVFTDDDISQYDGSNVSSCIFAHSFVGGSELELRYRPSVYYRFCHTCSF